MRSIPPNRNNLKPHLPCFWTKPLHMLPPAILARCCAVVGVPGWIGVAFPEVVQVDVELVEDKANLPQ